jgi:ferredoxin
MKVTTGASLATWLDALAERYTVIAPCRVEKELLYRPVTSSVDIVFEFERTILSPKTFLLPDTEVILEVEKRGWEMVLSDLAPAHDQVIFGVRPCDARGLITLDALLLDRSPPDTYYADRREKTVLIGLACPRMWEDCFCTSLGSAPDDASAVDVMLLARDPSHGEEDAGYLVQVITDKGNAVLGGLRVEEADGSVPASDGSGDEISVLPPEKWRSLFDDRYWQRLADRCLSCHACTYVCPTCRCFDVRDDTTAAGPGFTDVQRLRAWDSCLAAAYRRIAGGHNPRPSKAQRLRNRFYCKFCYSPLDFGAVACVGCGRCTDVCPVGIDIAEMLGDVARLERSG